MIKKIKVFNHIVNGIMMAEDNSKTNYFSVLSSVINIHKW